MAADYPEYEWRDTGRGVWARDIDEPETMYAALSKQWEASGRSFFHMTGHLSLKVAVREGQSRASAERNVDNALAQAWLALRFHHPAIASQVKWDHAASKFVKEYPVASEGWLEETFVPLSTGQSGAEWANSDPPAPPLPTLNVIAPPLEGDGTVLRDLVFRSPHDVIDGIGTLLLFDNYVRLAAQALEQGDDYKAPSLQDPRIFENLSPPFRVAAAVPPRPSDAVKRRLESIAAADRADAAVDAELAVLPYRKGALVPGVHKRIEVVLSPEETSKLAAACKDLGVSVTHVFHAAIALTLRDLQPESPCPREVQYVGYLLRNERGRCVQPYNDHRHPTGVYHSVSGEKLVVKMDVAPRETEQPEPRKLEFLRIVRQMREFYTAVRDDDEHYALAPHLFAGVTPQLPDGRGEAGVVPPPADSPSATISSMGRIDGVIAQKQGAFEVYNPWVTGEELRSGLGLFLGTFRGALSLSAAYNDAWHGSDATYGFLRSCLDIVGHGLGVSISGRRQFSTACE